MLLLSAHVFLLVLTCSYANTVYFNNSAGYLCIYENPCQFNDSAIWMNGEAPNDGDQVYINVDPSMGYHVYVELTNSPIETLDVLAISGPISFVLDDQVSFVECTVDDSASFIVEGNAIFSSINITQLGSNSTLRLTNSSIFLQEETTAFYTTDTSVVDLRDSSAMILSSLEIAYFSGSLYVGASVLFQSGVVSFEDATILFEGTPQFDIATFVNVQAQFLGGFSATGEVTCYTQTNMTIFGIIDVVTMSLSQDSEVQIVNATGTIGGLSGASDPGLLVISSSNIAISAPDTASIDVALLLAGNTTISLQNITINQSISFASGYFGEPADISLMLSATVNMVGDYNIPGQMVVTDGQFTSSGNLTLSGGIQAQASSIVVEGSLTAGGPIILDFGTYANTSSMLNIDFPANLSAPYIQIQKNSQLQVKGPVSIFSSVMNSGIFQVNRGSDAGYNQNISIIGNYTQLPGGIFVAYLDNNVSSTVYVSGSASINNGLVTYTFSGEFPKDAKFLILKASNRLEGQFNGSLHAYSPSGLLDLENLIVQYDKSSVFLAISHNSSNIFMLWGMQWWIWATILLAAVVVLIIAVISAVVKVRASNQRLKYQVLRSADPMDSTASVSSVPSVTTPLLLN